MERKDHGNISVSYQGGYSDLLCPRCDSEYLHQIGVTFYDRPQEDGPVTIVRHGSMADLGYDNPSSRRDGLAVAFYCENCDPHAMAGIELTFAQHKGTTQLAWRFRPIAEK